MNTSDENQPVDKPPSDPRVQGSRLAKTQQGAVIAALVSAFSTLICPIAGFIRDSGEICGYKADTFALLARLMPVALIAAGLGALLARQVHKYLAIVLGIILLAVLAVINIFMMIGPAGC